MFIPFNLNPHELERLNQKLQQKYLGIKESSCFSETMNVDDADILVVAFGSMARIVKTVIRKARTEGIKAGLFRPVSLWPFPEASLREITRRIRKILVVEMNCGQMLEDVDRAVKGNAIIDFYGRSGGMIPTTDEVLSAIETLVRKQEAPQ